MKRVIKPLKLFIAKFQDDNGKLPIQITGSRFTKPIHYNENLGSAQCKSAVMIAALKTLDYKIKVYHPEITKNYYLKMF